MSIYPGRSSPPSRLSAALANYALRCARLLLQIKIWQDDNVLRSSKLNVFRCVCDVGPSQDTASDVRLWPTAFSSYCSHKLLEPVGATLTDCHVGHQLD